MRWFTRAWHQGELTDAEWDAVNADYERHVQQLGPSLPSAIRVLGEAGGQLSLHDGRFINVEKKLGSQDTLLVDIATRDMQQGSLIGNQWSYPLLHVRIAYLGAHVREPSWEALDDLARQSTTEILYGEVDRNGDGSFEHRMLLWPSDVPSLAISFDSVELAAVRFVDGRAEIVNSDDLG